MHAVLFLSPALLAPLLIAVYRPVSGKGPFGMIVRAILGLIVSVLLPHPAPQIAHHHIL